MKKVLFVLTATFALSCKGQNNNSYNESLYVYRKDTVNEVNQVCRLFVNTNDSSYRMLKFYGLSNPSLVTATMFIKNGKYNGPCTYWTEAGELSFYGEYFDDMRHGKWVSYYSNGTSFERYYDKGRKVGVWKEFDKSGKVVREIDHGN